MRVCPCLLGKYVYINKDERKMKKKKIYVYVCMYTHIYYITTANSIVLFLYSAVC